MLLLLVMMLVITCVLMLMLVLMLRLLMLLMLLTRVGMRVLVLRVRQSFVVHGGLEAQLRMPGLRVLSVMEVWIWLMAWIGVGVEERGGEVEQGVLLGEVEVLHGAWDSGFGQYTRRVR